MSDDVLDEANRPRPSGSVELLPEQREAGAHLKMVHDHFRAEIGKLVRLADEVANDEVAVAELTNAADVLSMRRNYEAFGTFCGLACRGVTMHHRIEDAQLFSSVSHLEIYAPLIEKLKTEHVLIHDQLIPVDKALVAFKADNAAIAQLQSAIHALQQALFSHLDYEDEQLPEPLGVLGLP